MLLIQFQQQSRRYQISVLLSVLFRTDLSTQSLTSTMLLRIQHLLSALPLGGVELRGIPGLALRYGESELDTLLQGGVTPVELAGGVCSVVRGVTTRTTTGGVSDSTWRELTTILVVDDVIPGVRNALRAKFPRAKNTAQTRGAVRSQVILELERKLASEIITGYGEVTVQPLEEAPTVCLVTFSFTVAHGLNQIWLSAQITV